MLYLMLKNKTIKAPFTKEQVTNINIFQNNGRFHPFTCDCSEIDSDEHKGQRGVLVATVEGLVCPYGKYKQNWVDSFMTEPDERN